MRRAVWTTVWAGLAYALLAGAWVEVGLARGQLVVGRDLDIFHYPRLLPIGEALAAGRLPLWNPWADQGAPWWGPRAGGVVYPANVLFGLLPAPRAIAVFLALHAVVAALGARRLSRALEASRDGAWLGGLAYGLGGFVTSQHWGLPFLVSAAWLPWAAAGGATVGAALAAHAGEARGAARRWAPPGLPAIALGAGACVLAGEPQGALAAAGAAALLGVLTARAPSASWRAVGSGGGEPRPDEVEDRASASSGGARPDEAGAPDPGRTGASAARAQILGRRVLAARALAWVVLAALLGAALGGPQTLSILAELPEIDRTAGTFRDARWGLSAGPLASLLVPGALGEHALHRGAFWGAGWWGGQPPWCDLSLGALGLALAAAALAGAWRPRAGRGPGAPVSAGGEPARAGVEGALALALAGLALAAFDVGALVGLRFSVKWLSLAALGLACLAGLGLDAVLRGAGPPGARSARRGTCRAAFGVALGVLGLSSALALAATLDGPGGRVEALLRGTAGPTGVDAAAARAALASAAWRSALAAGLALAWLVASGRLTSRVGEAPGVGAAGEAAGDGPAGAPARAAPARGRARCLLVASAVAVLALDLLTTAKPALRATAPDLLAPGPLALALAARPGDPAGAPTRLGSPSAWHVSPAGAEVDLLEAWLRFHRDRVEADLGYLHGIRHVGAFETVRPRALALFDEAASRLPPLERHARRDAEVLVVPTREAATLRAAGAQALGVDPGHGHEALVNPRCPPWAYFVPEAVAAGSLPEAVLRATDPARDPRRQVVVGPEGAALVGAPRPGAPSSGPAPAGGGAREAAVRVVAWAPERVELEVAAPAEGWLVVRDAPAPGWLAAVDGEPVATARADALFRAVRVGPGRGGGPVRVVWTYRPGWFAPGLTLTLGAALALAALAVRALGASAPRRGSPAR